MPLNDAAFDAFEKELNDKLSDGLVRVMEDTETEIKESHRWRDDTGSLSASVRGYVVGKTDPRKYFGDARWQGAQTGRIQSRYLSAFPQNTPEHYEPHVESIDAGENENTIVGILTSFVGYAEEVENDLRIGGTFSEAMYDTLQRNLNKEFGK